MTLSEEAQERLADMGVVEIVQKTVPTFRLAVPRADIDVGVRDE